MTLYGTYIKSIPVLYLYQHRYNLGLCDIHFIIVCPHLLCSKGENPGISLINTVMVLTRAAPIPQFAHTAYTTIRSDTILMLINVHSLLHGIIDITQTVA